MALDLVNTLRVVQLESPESRKSRDPQVQRVLRNHLKDPGVHVDTKVKQVLLQHKVLLAPRDHKDPREKLERRVIQVLEVPQVPRGFRDCLKDRDVPPVSPLEFDWEFDSFEYFLFFIVSLMFREFSLRCWLFAITFTLVC